VKKGNKDMDKREIKEIKEKLEEEEKLE